MCGKSMAQCMRRQRPGNAGSACMRLDTMPESLTGHTVIATPGKQRRPCRITHQLATTTPQVARQPVYGFLTQRDQPVLVALATHPYHTLTQVNGIQAEIDQLRYAQPATIKHFKHGPVTQAQRSVDVGSRQQTLHLLFVEGVGQKIGRASCGKECRSRWWQDREKKKRQTRVMQR